MGDISKYPNLERYYKHFEETNGRSERHDDSFPNFIIWIRLVVEPEEGEWTDPAKFFELDEDDAFDRILNAINLQLSFEIPQLCGNFLVKISD